MDDNVLNNLNQDLVYFDKNDIQSHEQNLLLQEQIRKLSVQNTNRIVFLEQLRLSLDFTDPPST